MKNFTDLFIQRPVLSTAISLIIFVFGLVSFHHMALRLYPKVISPIITVNTIYPGASSQVMNVM